MITAVRVYIEPPVRQGAPVTRWWDVAVGREGGSDLPGPPTRFPEGAWARGDLPIARCWVPAIPAREGHARAEDLHRGQSRLPGDTGSRLGRLCSSQLVEGLLA